MTEQRGPNLFGLPPGVDFAAEFVAGLRERFAGQPPEAMARVRVYLNSERMRRRVVDLFTDQAAQFLPQLHLVADLGHDPVLRDRGQPVSPLRRRLELAQLVARLLDRQPDLAMRSALYDLADGLAKLMDEMQAEGVSPAALTALDVSDHSEHWFRTQSFLRIIAPICADETDAGARQRLAALRLADQWHRNPPRDPVIVAGSTGSRGTTQILIAAVAALDKGAVVVPGYDFDLPDHVWQTMSDELTAEDHPQFRFRKLMQMLDISPGGIVAWRSTQPPAPQRNQLVSLALRPAPVTDQWLHDGQDLPDLIGATEGMTLVEATSPRTEALAIALMLRRAAQDGTSAALVTPDRVLSRRVAAALDHWGIIADDAAGSPLALSAPGRLLRHVADMLCRRMTAESLITLLKHPLTCSTTGRGDHLRFTRDLELSLRRHGPAFPTAASVVAWASAHKDGNAIGWAQALALILDAFAADAPGLMTEHVQRHMDLTLNLVRGTGADAPALWDRAAGDQARLLMQNLATEAPFGGEMTALAYRDIFESVIHQSEVRQTITPHPGIYILGPREAREMRADLVILGGLTDGIWPAAAPPDFWLNRTMRKDAGLLLPERQIGLSAHDFQQAIAARQVIMTRALRNADSETVPSRWLNRLCNLMDGLPTRNGPAALQAMRDRGQYWLRQVTALEQPTVDMGREPALHPALRPMPQPPVASRPTSLSLTRIGILIRDPYAIYARYILRLKPLDALNAGPDPRSRGNAVHSILKTFVQTRPPQETQPEARLRLLSIARETLATEVAFPVAQCVWMARIDHIADHFLTQDSRLGGVAVLVEKEGAIRLDKMDFTLHGTPDRIDRLPDGRLHLIDYKTGSPPSEAQQKQYEKQLLLTAVMVERGGFADIGPATVDRFTYVGLNKAQKIVETIVTETVLAEVWEGVNSLVRDYFNRDTGYTARRAMFDGRSYSDYDHLSRYGEWGPSDRAVPIRVGGAS